MPILFSPSKAAFYDTDIVSVVAPDDAVITTPEARADMIAALGRGCAISVSADGALVTVDPPISELKSALIAQLYASCQRAIYAGFSSAALGADHFYPTADLDQRNLQSAVLAGQGQTGEWSTPLWCQSGNAWTFGAHSAAQLTQVNADWVAHRVSAQQRYVDLVAEVNAATEDQLSTITW
ncbi:hypothetical protein PCO31111_05027 [Pandoraea communis]|uniref:DUF4376 domain-containing protein n=1 Tax=Pandoraea communis TaxID=2508297 RepID=A0A5E4Z4K4_9BURK|nr:hypothetical protein [Pandoraea communis]VVE55260.1 hypothetical protein PCO31111_05027 [Pandoraea communis]